MIWTKVLQIIGISYDEIIKLAEDDEYKKLFNTNFLNFIKDLKKYIAFFKEIKNTKLSDDKNKDFEKIKSLYEKIIKYFRKIDNDEEINRLFNFAFKWSMDYKDKIAP